MDDDCHRVGWIYGDSLTMDELKNLNPESKTKWGDGNEATKIEPRYGECQWLLSCCVRWCRWCRWYRRTVWRVRFLPFVCDGEHFSHTFFPYRFCQDAIDTRLQVLFLVR